MIKKLLTYLLPALLLTGCVEEDQFSNSPTGNYDALWSIIDERYCFFEQARQQHGCIIMIGQFFPAGFLRDVVKRG